MLKLKRTVAAWALLSIIVLSAACTAPTTADPPANTSATPAAAPAEAATATPAPTQVSMTTAAAAAPTATSLKVGSVDDIKIQDSARGKTLEARVTYPEGGAGPYPIIIFSPGLGGSKDFYQPLVRHWASHGYVVLQVNHDDAGIHDARGTKAWNTRPVDISTLIDHLDDIESRVPQVRGKLDRANIGVSGHSFGGQTAAMVAGYNLAGRNDMRDERVKAAILMAPPGNNESNTDTKASWSSIRIPLLTIVGGQDVNRDGNPPAWRMEAYRSSSSKDDYVLVVDEAEHGLGGIAGRTGPNAPPEEPDQMGLVFDASTTFWDAYLKKDRNACTKIASGAVVTESEAPARFESRDGVRVRSASAPPQAELATTRATTIVKRMDKNGDGLLSPNELPQQMSRAFDRLDQDGNGTLDEEEAQPIAERFDAQRGAGAGAGGARRRAGGAADGGAQPATPRTYPEMPPINQTTPSTNAVCHYG